MSGSKAALAGGDPLSSATEQSAVLHKHPSRPCAGMRGSAAGRVGPVAGLPLPGWQDRAAVVVVLGRASGGWGADGGERDPLIPGQVPANISGLGEGPGGGDPLRH